MKITKLLTFFVFTLAFSILFSISGSAQTQTGWKAFGPNNRWYGDTAYNFSNQQYSSITYDFTTLPNWQLWVGMRAWYIPGFNDGPSYCKTDTQRYAYNVSSTGRIYAIYHNFSYKVSGHWFDYLSAPYPYDTLSGYTFTSSYTNNLYADINYWTNGNGAFGVSNCDTSVVYQ